MLEIQKRLAENYWWIYLEDVAITQWRLGNLYVDMRRFNSAERLYSASLDTRSEFDREDIYRYRPATAQCQRSLGKLYEVHLKNYPKAEQCYRKSIEILQELCETNMNAAISSVHYNIPNFFWPICIAIPPANRIVRQTKIPHFTMPAKATIE